MQPIEITTSKARIVLIQVPAIATNIVVKNSILTYWDEGFARWGGFDLPPGQYTFLATTKTITEDLAKEVVEKNSYGHNGWKTYTEKLMYWEPTALASFTSLLLSKGVDVSKDYAVFIVK